MHARLLLKVRRGRLLAAKMKVNYSCKRLLYLTVKKSRQSHQEDLEDAGLEEGDLVIVVQALEAGDQFGEGTHLTDVIHKAFAKLVHEGVFGSAFHRTRLQWKYKG